MQLLRSWTYDHTVRIHNLMQQDKNQCFHTSVSCMQNMLEENVGGGYHSVYRCTSWRIVPTADSNALSGRQFVKFSLTWYAEYPIYTTTRSKIKRWTRNFYHLYYLDCFYIVATNTVLNKFAVTIPDQPFLLPPPPNLWLLTYESLHGSGLGCRCAQSLPALGN